MGGAARKKEEIHEEIKGINPEKTEVPFSAATGNQNVDIIAPKIKNFDGKDPVITLHLFRYVIMLKTSNEKVTKETKRTVLRTMNILVLRNNGKVRRPNIQ